jgi:hypothetical protein
VALAGAGAVYTGTVRHGAADATGHAVAAVGVAGAVLAAAALLALPVRATRLAPLAAHHVQSSA